MHLAVNAKRGPLCLYVRSLGWRGCCATRTDTNKPPRPATHTQTIYAYTHTLNNSTYTQLLLLRHYHTTTICYTHTPGRVPFFLLFTCTHAQRQFTIQPRRRTPARRRTQPQPMVSRATKMAASDQRPRTKQFLNAQQYSQPLPHSL